MKIGVWVFMGLSGCAFASTPALQLKPMTETKILISPNEIKKVKYIVINKSNKSLTLGMKSIPGVVQDTSDGNCNSPFILKQNESCVLNLEIIGKLVKTNYSGGPDVGSYSSPGLYNYRPSSKDSLSITKISSVFYGANIDGNSISICPVEQNGTFLSCEDQNNLSLQQPGDVILNQAGDIAYIMNMSNSSISVCPVKSNRTLDFCSTTGGNNQAFQYGGLAINNGYLYVTSCNDEAIYIYSLNANGSINNADSPTIFHHSTFSCPSGRVAFNANGTTIYIGYYSNGVLVCRVGSGGEPEQCTANDGNGTFNQPLGVAVDSTGSYLYVANTGANNISNVSICPINTDGSLGNCVLNTNNYTFYFDGYSANMFLSSENMGYFPNYGNDTISICPLEVNGEIGGCSVASDQTFNRIISAWIS